MLAAPGMAPEMAPAMADVFDAIEAEIPRLRRFAMVLVRDRDRADDLVQESLARALAGIEGWTAGTNLRAWLFTILRNVHLNDVRRENRAPFVAQDDEAGPQGTVAATQEADVSLRELGQILDRLSPEHRQILVLIAMEGFAYEEAALICDIPVGTVRSRLSRAREALRQALQGTGMLSPDEGT